MMSSLNDMTDRKYGQIAGNRHINDFIYLSFKYISEEDQHKFVKKFRDQPHDSDQIMHTFRELVLGAYLSSRGFRVRHDYAVEKKTPDWSIFDEQQIIMGIVELTNFHIDRLTEIKIKKRMAAEQMAVVWRDENKDNVERLYHCIWQKVDTYRVLIDKQRLPYVIAVFGEFNASIDFEEVEYCLLDKKIGLFKPYPDLSGVLYFQEKFGRYFFNYAQNPHAFHVMQLPEGAFPEELS